MECDSVTCIIKMLEISLSTATFTVTCCLRDKFPLREVSYLEVCNEMRKLKKESLAHCCSECGTMFNPHKKECKDAWKDI